MTLREYLFVNRLTATSFSKDLGVTAQYIRLIKRGERVPSQQLAQYIEMYTGGQVTTKELRS